MTETKCCDTALNTNIFMFLDTLIYWLSPWHVTWPEIDITMHPNMLQPAKFQCCSLQVLQKNNLQANPRDKKISMKWLPLTFLNDFCPTNPVIRHFSSLQPNIHTWAAHSAPHPLKSPLICQSDFLPGPIISPTSNELTITAHNYIPDHLQNLGH